MGGTRNIVAVGAAASLCLALGGSANSASGSAPSPQFRTFDKSSVPLAHGLPPSASAEDRKLFGLLPQQDEDLLNCYLRDRSVDEARNEAAHLKYSTLETKQEAESSQLTNGLFTSIIGSYYGKIDQTDLWLSKYWGNGLFTTILHVMPRSLKQLVLPDTVPTSLDKEEMRTDFKNPSYALIDYRSQPLADTGMDGIIFTADAEFVKFKELYQASQHYCRTLDHSGSVSVVGWRRTCEKGDKFYNGLRNSGVTNETDAIMSVGFICN